MSWKAYDTRNSDGIGVITFIHFNSNGKILLCRVIQARAAEGIKTTPEFKRFLICAPGGGEGVVT